MIDVRFNDSDPISRYPRSSPLRRSRKAPTARSRSAGTVTTPAGGASGVDQPNPNFFGSDSFTYTIKDISGDTATGTVNVTVTPVNDVPSFVKGANDSVMVNSGAQTVNGWATPSWLAR